MGVVGDSCVGVAGRRSARILRNSYIRERRGSVHSVVVVPAGRRSYVLTTVSQAGRKDVAREIGGIVTSFGL
ncbi:MAG: hypothetical protein QOJ82_2019 [Solirubrobacteraceae bacterium]|nr:hypothetical protein [Solirubrobacteraceae bacterium]